MREDRVSTVKWLIEKGLPNSKVEVRSVDGVHFEATVTSPLFSGKSTVQQHRMVYDCLGDHIGGEIHALSLQTAEPDTG